MEAPNVDGDGKLPPIEKIKKIQPPDSGREGNSAKGMSSTEELKSAESATSTGESGLNKMPPFTYGLKSAESAAPIGEGLSNEEKAYFSSIEGLLKKLDTADQQLGKEPSADKKTLVEGLRQNINGIRVWIGARMEQFRSSDLKGKLARELATLTLVTGLIMSGAEYTNPVKSESVSRNISPPLKAEVSPISSPTFSPESVGLTSVVPLAEEGTNNPAITHKEAGVSASEASLSDSGLRAVKVEIGNSPLISENTGITHDGNESPPQVSGNRLKAVKITNS